MKTESSDWVKAIQNGLIGGGISLLLCLIGMVQAFAVTYIIKGVITMAQIFVFAPILLMAYLTVSRSQTNKLVTRLAIGALSGFLGGVILSIPIILNLYIDLRSVFINFSPALINILTFGLPLQQGIPILLVISAIVGMIGVGLILLPARIRRATTSTIIVIIFLGLFRDMIVTIISSWEQLVPGLSHIVGKGVQILLYLFAQSGLSIPGTIIVSVITFSVVYWRAGRIKPPARAPVITKQQRLTRLIVMFIIAIVILLFPWVMGPYLSEIADQVGIFILMGLGLNIVVGFAGLLDLGYVAFYAIGAYTLGVLTTTEAVGIGHLSFWVALPIAVVVAVFAGVVLGLPILRMRGDYLAIVTLGFGEIIRILVLSDWLVPILSGPNGVQHLALPRIAIPGLFSVVLDNQQKIYYLILVAIAIAGFVAVRLKDSHLGRSWMALREDEDVAEAMGINKVITKLLAFGMGALFSGLGGALFAAKIGSVYPSTFSFLISINILALIIIGGIASIPGVFVGSAVLVGLPLLLSQFADFRYFIYGAALVAMMLYRPEGLWPEQRRRLELHEDLTEVQVQPPVTAVLKTPGE